MEKGKEVNESSYKADFMISENYIKFSSELLRLSLLAIGGFGTLILIKIKDKGDLDVFPHPLFFILALVGFVISAGAALFHRYYATDVMSWYISYLRAENTDNQLKMKEEKQGLHAILKYSRISLVTCEISFGLGVILFFIAILSFIY